jgi:hypothetical protein
MDHPAGSAECPSERHRNPLRWLGKQVDIPGAASFSDGVATKTFVRPRRIVHELTI